MIVPVVLPTEGDLAWLDRDQAPVGDGDSMGVAGQVLENLLGTSERGFAIDHPVGLFKTLEIAIPAVGLGEVKELTVKRELALTIGCT